MSLRLRLRKKPWSIGETIPKLDTWEGRDLWDGAWWTVASQRLKEDFWPWFEQARLDTHLRDQINL